MKSDGWAILWKESEIAGYTDYFPPGSLDRPAKRLSHLVTGPRGWRGIAICSVRVDGLRTLLDYTSYTVENDAADMDVGIMILTFDSNEKEISKVEWQDPRRRNRRVNVITSVRNPPIEGEYRPRRGRLRRPALVTPRGAQGRFRVSVRAAYGDSCAITGCDVAEALEAVHIDPYENTSQHHPRNGLLLRRDLHVLFDRSLIAVNPISMRIEVAPNLRRYPEYRVLHRKRGLGNPVTGYEGYAPDEGALKRRWETFLESAAAEED